MSPKEFINNLQRENSAFGSDRQAEMVASLLDTVSSDIYSESQRFVFELIQNADDSTDGITNEVHFDFSEKALIVSHNGKRFSEDNIVALAGAGASTKKSDPSKTGYKGIGFKSVFGKSKRVTVLSGDYCFRFDKTFHAKKKPWQIIPIWTELKDLPSEIHSAAAKLKFNVSTIIELENALSLQSDLKTILDNGQILLFLRKVTKISVVVNGVHQYNIEKVINSQDGIFNEVELTKNKARISSWIVRTFDRIPVPAQTQEELRMDETTPEKLRDVQFCDISFAIRTENGRIKALGKGESTIFTYLPTKVNEFNFPFLVNGSFLTNASREALHEDRIWNQWLFETIAAKILDWLSVLSSSKYKFQILHALPSIFSQPYHKLMSAFDSSFKELVKEKKFILSENEKPKTVTEVLLDKTGLSIQAFIKPQALLEFLKSVKGLNLGEDCFVSSRVEEASKLTAIGVETFELANIHTFFSSEPFTKSHTISENINLIKYLKDKSDTDKEGVWFETVQRLPFIFDDKSILRNPETGVCFPTIGKETELGDLSVIHPDVYKQIEKDKVVYSWLKALGVKEPSKLTTVTNIIIPRINDADFVNVDSYLQITHFLFRLYHEGQLDDEILEKLRQLRLKVKGSTIEFQPAEQCFMAAKYGPLFNIEGLINEVPFVSEDYLTLNGNQYEWAAFFKAIKVKDRIEVRTINSNATLPILRVATTPEWVDGCQAYARQQYPNGFGFDELNTIVNIKEPTFLKHTSRNYQYSKLFWKQIISAGVDLQDLTTKARYRYGEGRGRNAFACSGVNYFEWYIRTQACIPTSIEKLVKAEEVFVNEKEIEDIAGKYLPVFDIEETIPTEWRTFLKLKTKLGWLDLLDILTNVHLKARDEEKKISPSVRRIGLVYNKLAAMLPDMTPEEKQVIQEWSEENMLYTTDESFEPARKLNWITIDGFSPEAVEMKVIKVPENCQKATDSFKELMILMGVQIIDKFIPTFVGEEPEYSLKERLEKVLPYFAAVVAKKEVDDPSQVYHRLYETLDKTAFFKATEINLSFKDKEELVKGPSLVTYTEENRFYFRGKWWSERTLLDLITELSKLLKVEASSGELRFLLREDDKDEVNLWLQEENIDLATIPASRTFSKRPTPKQTTLDIGSTAGEEDSNKKEEPTQVGAKKEEVSRLSTKFTKFEPSMDVDKMPLPEFKFTPKTSTEISTEEIPIYQEMEDEESRQNVGRWSERFVYLILQKNGQYNSIKWENEVTEQYKPYDIKAIKDGKEVFFEVKGTPSRDKCLVPFSAKEIDLMYEKKEDYIFVRVYNAGNADAIPVVLKNPYEGIQAGAIKIVLQVPLM